MTAYEMLSQPFHKVYFISLFFLGSSVAAYFD